MTLRTSSPGERARPEALSAELAWFGAVTEQRMRAFLDDKDVSPMAPAPVTSPLADVPLVPRLVLGMGLAVYLAPEVLDPLHVRNPVLDRPYTEVGLTPEGAPTLATVAFLLGGDVAARLTVSRALRAAPLKDWVDIDGDPLSSKLCLSAAALKTLTAGAIDLPSPMPAQPLTTALGWEDLVLPEATRAQVDEVLAWLDHGAAILRDPVFGRALSPGYSVLFHGGPGCGKTLTAALLGQRSGRPVWRIDLSQTVSKWIGETEKNLGRLFDMADRDDVILFFDEADALFARRTEVRGANDRYANQLVGYVLTRIEACRGMVILASNLKSNIDAAFTRRFQSIIAFPAPGPGERHRLWQGLLSDPGRLGADIDLKAIAEDCDLPGGGIVNAVRSAALSAARDGRHTICRADLDIGIAKEHRKAGRLMRTQP